MVIISEMILHWKIDSFWLSLQKIECLENTTIMTERDFLETDVSKDVLLRKYKANDSQRRLRNRCIRTDEFGCAILLYVMTSRTTFGLSF